MRRLILCVCLLVGCGDDDAPAGSDGAVAEVDAAATAADAGPSGSDASCYDNPTTHFEIINACTSAQAIDKEPVLPLLEDDGSLPPLPE